MKNLIRVITKIETFPANFYLKIFVGLILYLCDQSAIFFTLLKPLFTVIADPLNFLYFLLIERESLEVSILSCVKLRKCTNTVVGQDFAQGVHMIRHADLLYLIDFIPKGEFYYVRPDGKTFIIFYIHSLFRNVHPSAIFTIKIYHIEILEPIEFQLGMFRR